jgi:hypothetical protein
MTMTSIAPAINCFWFISVLLWVRRELAAFRSYNDPAVGFLPAFEN